MMSIDKRVKVLETKVKQMEPLLKQKQSEKELIQAFQDLAEYAKQDRIDEGIENLGEAIKRNRHE